MFRAFRFEKKGRKMRRSMSVEMEDYFKMNQPFVILSIDGGGTRGLLAAYFIRKLQSKLPLPIHMYFDLFSGTSTGSILTVMMGCPQIHYNDINYRKEFLDPVTPSDIVELYKNAMKGIFFQEETNPYVSKMIGAGVTVGVLIAAHRFRKYLIKNKTIKEQAIQAKQSSFMVSSLFSRIVNDYLEPTTDFFNEFFNISKSSEVPIWVKSGFFNFLVFIFFHTSMKTMGRNLRKYLRLSSSFSLIVKGVFYLVLFYILHRSFSFESKNNSNNNLNNSSSQQDYDSSSSSSSVVSLMKKSKNVRMLNAALFCGISSGISGFLSGVASGLMKWNSTLQILRKGLSQGILSTIFGGVSGISANLVFRGWTGLFGKEMSGTSRLLMMIVSGLLSGVFDLVLHDKLEKNIQHLYSPKYPESKMSNIFNEVLGDETKLSDSLTNMLVTCFDIRNLVPHVITHNDDILAYKAIVASTAAPTFFKPLKIEKKIKENEEREQSKTKKVLLDGGLWANNPALLSYVYVKQNGIEDENIYMISVGTGRYIRRPSKMYKESGGLDWLDTVLDINMDGMAIHSIMTAIFCNDETPNKYTRIQGNLKEAIPIDVIDYHLLMEEARRISEEENWEEKAQELATMLEELRRQRIVRIVLKPYKSCTQI